MTTTQAALLEALPPLPKWGMREAHQGVEQHWYTADQMRAYGEACARAAEAAQPEPVAWRLDYVCTKTGATASRLHPLPLSKMDELPDVPDGYFELEREVPLYAAPPQPAPIAAQADEFLPLLLRDLCRELGVSVPEAAAALRGAGLGEVSQGTAVTPAMASVLRDKFEGKALAAQAGELHAPTLRRAIAVCNRVAKDALNADERDAAKDCACNIELLLGFALTADDAAQAERCPHCDDTGDVTSITGEWRGYCHCPAGRALAAQAGPAQAPLTDDVLLKIAREHAGTTIKLTRDVGPYEVTEPTHVYRLIARAIWNAALAAAPQAPAEPPTRSQKLAAAGFTRRPSLWAMEAREALELIATPKRPDGTWNRDREACRQLAAEALGRYENEPVAPAEQQPNPYGHLLTTQSLWGMYVEDGKAPAEPAAQAVAEVQRLRAALGAVHWRVSRSDTAFDEFAAAVLADVCEQALPELHALRPQQSETATPAAREAGTPKGATP